jgi:hypothetical protein
MVQEAMELDRPLGAPELGPVEEGPAQVDHRRVQADQLILEPELPPALRQGLAAKQQGLEHGPAERGGRPPRGFTAWVGDLETNELTGTYLSVGQPKPQSIASFTTQDSAAQISVDVPVTRSSVNTPVVMSTV